MTKGEVENDSAREENLENIMSREAPIINRVVLRALACAVLCTMNISSQLSVFSHVYRYKV